MPLVKALVAAQTNNAVDLTGSTGAVVLTGTNDSTDRLAEGVCDLSGLTGSAGSFVVRLKINGRTQQPSPITIVCEAASSMLLRTGTFMLPAGATFEMRVKSPNADVSVTTIGQLFEIDTDEPGSLLTVFGCPVQGGGGGGGSGGGGPTWTNVNTSQGAFIGGGVVDADPMHACTLYWGHDMSVTQIDSESGTGNIGAAYVLVSTCTPHATLDKAVIVQVTLGDGSGSTGDLGGVGGNYTFRATIAGRTLQPSPITVAVEAVITEVVLSFGPIIVPANQELKFYVKSPNAGENAVAHSAKVFDVDTTWSAVRASNAISGTFGEALQSTVASRATPAQVNTECDTALADYDGPTYAEMVAAFTQIKGASWTIETLKAIYEKECDCESAIGPGAIAYTYTVYDTDGVTPLPGIRVWLTVSPTNSQLAVAGPLVSDAAGECEFLLDEGVYYAWRVDTSRPGRNFTNPSNPDTFTVVAP